MGKTRPSAVISTQSTTNQGASNLDAENQQLREQLSRYGHSTDHDSSTSHTVLNGRELTLMAGTCVLTVVVIAIVLFIIHWIKAGRLGRLRLNQDKEDRVRRESSSQRNMDDPVARSDSRSPMRQTMFGQGEDMRDLVMNANAANDILHTQKKLKFLTPLL